jgi:hypothetical protein
LPAGGDYCEGLDFFIDNWAEADLRTPEDFASVISVEEQVAGRAPGPLQGPWKDYLAAFHAAEPLMIKGNVEELDEAEMAQLDAAIDTMGRTWEKVQSGSEATCHITFPESGT